jgi:hypothetical protein
MASAEAPDIQQRFSMITQAAPDGSPISIGQLPPADRVRVLVRAAHERFRTDDSGPQRGPLPSPGQDAA